MPASFQFASAATKQGQITDAVRELVDDIRLQIAGEPLDLALVFLSPHFIDQAEEGAAALGEELAPRVLIGCTGEGVIGSREEIERAPAITLVVAALPGVDLVPARLGSKELLRSRNEGRPAIEGVGEFGGAELFLLLGDPFTTPMDHVLDAFNNGFEGVPVIGGMASGARHPGRNALIMNDSVYRDGAVAVAFSGALSVDVIVSQGCRPVGPLLEVTRAQANVIQHLEGKPPLDHLQNLVEELSDDDRELLKNGLFVGRAIDSTKEILGRGDFLIRGVMGLDQETGALTVGDFIDDGEIVQFHLRDAATATEDLEMMLTPQALFGQPSGAFLFSCNGRGTRLYNRTNGDVSPIQEFFPGINLAGFFCAGEIGPIGGRNFLHGHTASLALIRPRAGEREA